MPALAQGNRIVLGQSAAFTGPAAQLGIQMNSGARIYFNALNAQGGVEYISRNSYSSAWGDDGYCYFPEAVLQALVFEARTTA